MSELELFKKVFRLALGLDKLNNDYSFGEIRHTPNYRTILIERFNRKLPSDEYRMQIMNNNNDVFLEVNFNGDYLDQSIWNQAKIQELLKNNLMSSMYIQQVDKI
jgi:hypothetical protein